MSEQNKPFAGFQPSNTTPVPDVFFDELLPDLSNAELRVLLYIFRRTWGFKKDTDAISFNQFLKGITTKDGKVLDRGCGVTSRGALSKALRSLEERGCITTKKGKDPLGDNQTTLYSIRFIASVATNQPQGGSAKNELPVVPKSNHRSSKNVPPVVLEMNQQETVLQETGKQQTDRQKESRSSFLTSEQLRIDEWYCQYVTVPPKITDKLKEYWTLLAPHIKTQQDMESLFEYTKARIRGNDPRVHPGNLVNQLDSWRLEYAAAPLPNEPQEKREVEQPIYREHVSLPVDMQEWMIDTAREFGGDEQACVNELQWCFQHTGCTEEEFYAKLIRAYGIAEKSKCIDTLFAEIKQSLSLIIDAVMVS